MFSKRAHYSEFGNAHNHFANEVTSFVYSIGLNTCNTGLHVIDMSDPFNPKFAGRFGKDECGHDVQCVFYTGRMSNM